MKRFILFIFIFAIQSHSFAANGDTTKIKLWNKYDLQQWKGSQYHKLFAYRDPSISYKKAYLTINLGCASYGCCVWDYTFQAYITKPLPGYDTTNYRRLDTVTGNSVTVVLDSLWINRKTDNYEVGRLITPYGTYMRANSNGFSNNTWTHPYIYDVTDYLPLMMDSFGVAVLTGGYDGKKGFNITADLVLIEGVSTYQPKNVIKVYQKTYAYKDETHIDTTTPAFSYSLGSTEKFAKFRSIVTGHGQQGEFSPIDYKVKSNSSEIFSKRLWREDCDETPVQPQGGTWIFSRCNWCPGERVETFEIDLSSSLRKTGPNEVDISFGPIENTSATQAADYTITGHIITYEKRDSADISIEEIIAPSKDPNYILQNPMCQGPMVRIVNRGIKTAKEAYIDYWVDKDQKTTFIWKGSLKTEESTIVNLPSFPWNGVDLANPKFYASLQKTLQNMVVWNDTIVSSFNLPAVFNTNFLKFEIRTTNDNKTNTLNIYNELGAVIRTRVYNGDSKLYTDTITLPNGCYRAELIDFDDRLSAGDGLSFWLSTQQLGKNSGSFRILNGSSNAVLKTFNPDFGGRINYQFSTIQKPGEYLASSEYNYQEYIFPDTIKTGIIGKTNNPNVWDIYPNPCADKFFEILLPNTIGTDIFMSISSLDGKVIHRQILRSKQKTEKIKLNGISEGIYILTLAYDDVVESKKLIMK